MGVLQCIIADDEPIARQIVEGYYFLQNELFLMSFRSTTT